MVRVGVVDVLVNLDYGVEVEQLLQPDDARNAALARARLVDQRRDGLPAFRDADVGLGDYAELPLDSRLACR